MTAREVLARVLAEGGQVIADPDRPFIVVPPALEPLVREHRRELRALIAVDAVAAHGLRETVDPEPANETSRPIAPVIGQRHAIGAYDACAACGTGMWIRFVDTPLCWRCADACGGLALA